MTTRKRSNLCMPPINLEAPWTLEDCEAMDDVIGWLSTSIPPDDRAALVHGDYRLDELFLVDGDFIVEDFSGDHARPLSERRLRGTPLRDVADMVRSIEYVALVAALDHGDGATLWALHWADAVGDAFVDAYLAAMGLDPRHAGR